MEVNESDPTGSANLEKVDHVVVVMLENRSFDHMLGYLSLTGRRPDIDGLRPGFANEYQGRATRFTTSPRRPLQMDPDHSASAIDLQIAGGSMSGFVASAAATLAARGVEDGDPGCVMGYYDGTDVPVYDHLAEEFAVCDRWFSSVPGATLPNRLYALSGAAAGSRDDRPAPCAARCTTSRLSSGTSTPTTSPGAGIPSTPGRCAWPTSATGWATTTGSATSARPACRGRPCSTSAVNPKIPSFLEDAAAGTLRPVSWIDPAFTNFNPLGFPVNDDHPPADIKDGQDLVLAVYDALASSPQWDRSLLVIVYDENGGFYDHVPPPQAADDEPEMFGSYGVRVPAIIVSPWIEPRTVSHTLFDHTSIIKTILLRFCPRGLRSAAGRERRPRLGLGPHYPGCGWPRPAISGNCSPAARHGPPRRGTPSCGRPRPGPTEPEPASPGTGQEE